MMQDEFLRQQELAYRQRKHSAQANSLLRTCIFTTSALLVLVTLYHLIF